jgi:hypothetical protein
MTFCPSTLDFTRWLYSKVRERKMQSVYIDIELSLYLKTNSLLPFIYDLELIDIFFKVQTFQFLEFYVKLSPT